MNRTTGLFNRIALVLALVASGVAGARAQVQPDTSRSIYQLEIPEITIIGKKAITLPFARKGETYDVQIYEAAPPDSSLLEQRPDVTLPIGSLPRYESPQIPFHCSAEGSGGSFGTVRGRVFADYTGGGWGYDGNAGFMSSQGHVDGATSSLASLAGHARTIVNTDNDILSSFRMEIGGSFRHDAYRMYGLPRPAVDRSRNDWIVDARMSSLEHRHNDLGLSFTADIRSVADSRRGTDSSISVVSPVLAASYGTDITDGFRLSAGGSYTSSALNYDRAVESPTLGTFDAGLEWQLTSGWFLQAGATVASGSGSSGENRSIVAPFAVLRWTPDADRQVRLFFKPVMRLSTYADQTSRIPFLVRELDINPERSPAEFGGSFWYNSDDVSFEVTGAVSPSATQSVVVADTAGRLRLSSVDANMVTIGFRGILHPSGITAIEGIATVAPAYESGTTTQLPMVPLVDCTLRGDLQPWELAGLYASVTYTSKRNTDLTGNESLGDHALLGAGIWTSVLPHAVLSLDLSNILNTSYDLWRGYSAPGFTVMANARINFR